MKSYIGVFVVSLLTVSSFGVGTVNAATTTGDLEVAGWVPYWQETLGTKSARLHMSSLDMIFPFGFTIKSDGTLKDLAGLDESKWKRLIRQADRDNTDVIPSIMSSDGQVLNRILSNTRSRTAHIAEIKKMVEDGRYAGVDIDYEGKLAETNPYFSLFLKELKAAIGSKTLVCTIEPRTPPESLYKVVPATINYSNDYKAIATHCDRVVIMAYDQQRADLSLNNARKGAPYFPVSDIDWVRKVVAFALKDIPADKIMLGIPTYGYHYRVTVSPDWYQSYERLGALNKPDLEQIAKDYKVTPGRNLGGELNFTYFPKESPYRVLSALPVPKGTQKGNEAAAQALMYANATGQTLTFNLASYGDATSAQTKIDLAKEFGLRGVALFKIDGEEDPDIWKNL
ncbi:hypothetical protein GW943_00420 [Candidatus Parcubacteria bacterium]|uniref:GH18 domain-containing protein n=1 Tax=Candidatus Kaiserbacteria bacterium CG10_big_fil_rev_8_21_14_0_10_47_16 TaxID=1974608 RepID=A0A2H0UD82_9BACT|nr:hypothetical protein [Candidatus Parcubacteria bacterium]PIR84310.1 MAG: hypothetical protein COU16_01805 [Candidatus Kaiserbacteria bacterium CG10_big_fil_rev_8_21_14_0_10_47_16]